MIISEKQIWDLIKIAKITCECKYCIQHVRDTAAALINAIESQQSEELKVIE